MEVTVSDVKLVSATCNGDCATCLAAADPDADIADAKAAIQARFSATTPVSVDQADINTAAAAKTYVEAQIATAISGTGVTADVTEVGFTAAVGGTATTPAGSAGEYTFTVTLSKGTGTPDTTATLKLNITATPADSTLVADAKTLISTAITATTFRVTQAALNSETAAVAHVQTAVDGVLTTQGKGVTATVTSVSFAAAVAGDMSTPAGTNGVLNFSVNIVKNADSDTLTGALIITATGYTAPIVDTKTRLNVDFSDTSVYTPGETIFANGAARWTQHSSGWYISEGSANAAIELEANTFPGLPAGVQVMKTPTNNNNRGFNIDLTAPIKRDTGKYLMELIFAASPAAGNHNYVAFSDTAYNALGTIGTYLNVNDNRGHLQINRNGSELRVRPVTAVAADGKYTYDGGISGLGLHTWLKMYAVIDTDEDKITYFIGSADDGASFSSVYSGAAAGFVASDKDGILTWGPGNEINSFNYCHNSSSNLPFYLGGIKITEYSEPFFGAVEVAKSGDTWDYMGFGWNPSQQAVPPNPLLDTPLTVPSAKFQELGNTTTTDANWGQGPAPIGWGGGGPLPFGTEIPNIVSTGPNVYAIGTTSANYTNPAAPRRWYATMFKKTFTMPDGFDPADITSISGVNNVSDGALIYINGVEVYRYRVSTSTTAPTQSTLGEAITYNGTRANGSSSAPAPSDSIAINDDKLTATTVGPVWSRTALVEALKPGENIITVIQTRAQGSTSGTALYFDLDLTIEFGGTLPANTQWKVTPPDKNVSRVGVGGQTVSGVVIGGNVLKLDNLSFGPDPEKVPLNGGTLEVTYLSEQTAQRRINVWTDLSGPAGAIEDIDFVTKANVDAGKILSLVRGRANTDYTSYTTVEFTLPKEMLYDPATDTVASVVYMSITTDNDATDDGANQRGWGNGTSQMDFQKIDTVKLTAAEPSYFPKSVALTIGAKPNDMSFGWFTPKGEATQSVVQIVEADKLVNGKLWPEGDPSVTVIEKTGTPVTGAYNLDSNMVKVYGVLEKNKEYAYRVGDGNDDRWSKIYLVKTFDPTDPSFTFIAVGDPQISTGEVGNWRKTVDSAIAKAEERGDGGARFMLSAGDQVNYGNDLTETSGYLEPDGLKTLPVATSVGNHDTDGTFRQGAEYEDVGLQPLVYDWPQAAGGVEYGKQKGGRDYYFSYGNTLYISLNANVKDVDEHRPLIVEALASHPDAKWRIALYHQDIYGGGSHASPKGYSDAYNMQPIWGPFMDEFDFDLVLNGHDHVYARSHYMQGNEIQKYQYNTVLDVNETNALQANSGVYVAPKGIQYLGLSGASTKFYALEDLPWVAFGEPQKSTAQYSIITIDDNTLEFAAYYSVSGALVDSFKIRKQATYEDLQSLIDSTDEARRGDITAASWGAFQDAITAARAVAPTADTAIHAAYMAIYDTYYALEVGGLDKTALGDLIDEVTAKLAVSSEGRWEGQYPIGSKAEVQALLDAAIEVYEFRLSTLEEVDTAYNALKTRYDKFLGSVSEYPCPYEFSHDIPASGEYTMDLIEWMLEDEVYHWGTADKREFYDAHYTKQHFAMDIVGAMRSEAMWGPANAEGGRGRIDGHITKTHIGQWIKYELHVAEAGWYKVQLGGVNATTVDQKWVIRNPMKDVVARFVIPANTPLPADDDWEKAGLYEADQEIYLTRGVNIIELFNMSNEVGVDGSSGSGTNYPDGAEIDIMTLERTSNTAPAPVYTTEPNIFLLPRPQTAAGTASRQQGWATTGVTDEHGMTAFGVPVNVMAAAEKLIVEVAGLGPGVMDRPTSVSTRTLQLTLDMKGWNQSEPLMKNLVRYTDADKKTWGEFAALEFDLKTGWVNGTGDVIEYTGYDTLRGLQSGDTGRIIISYYNYGWEELQVMKAYLVLTDDRNPCAGGHTPSEENCSICAVCQMALPRTCTEDDPCLAHDNSNPCSKGHTPSAANCTVCAVCGTTGLPRTCTPANPCAYHNTAGDEVLEEDTRQLTITYNPDAAEAWQIWSNGEINFLKTNTILDADYAFEFDILSIDDSSVSGGSITVEDLLGQLFAAGNVTTNYAWTTLSPEAQNASLTLTGNELTATLSEEEIQFAFENLDRFGFQISVNEDGTGREKFAAGDSLKINISYKLIQKGAGGDGHTVTFNGNGGSPAEQIKTVAPGQSLGANFPTTPVRAGYTFTGWNAAVNGTGAWFTSSTPVNEDITVYAQWQTGVNTYTVTFNGNGGNPAVQARTVTSGQSLGTNFPYPPTLYGYTFLGWRRLDNDNLFYSDTPVNADITVYAQWSYNGYTGGGTVGGSGKTPSQPTPTFENTPSDWAAAAVKEAVRLNIVPKTLQYNYHNDILRSEFCGLAVGLYEYLSGGKRITARGSFSDTYDVNVLKLAGLGIVTGDGTGKFNPNGVFSREMAITLMYNMMIQLGYEFEDAEPDFADAGQISSWARKAIGALQKAGIIQGDGTNFNPKEDFSREMGILTVMNFLAVLEKK